MDDTIKYIGLNIAVIAFSVLAQRGCNAIMNNRTITEPTYQTVSYSNGLNGHVDYTLFNDGSQDIKIYPNWGHEYANSKLYQDLDGDCLVNRIRKNGPSFKMHRLNEILIREADYHAHQDEFDEADAMLQELGQEYFDICMPME